MNQYSGSQHDCGMMILTIHIFTNHFCESIAEKKIQDIVETLYQKGEKELADRICNMYFMKGSYTLLKEIYEKHRNNGKIVSES